MALSTKEPPMTTMAMDELSSHLRKIDFCLLCTQREDGRMATRPMSNNGNVEYDGDSWFFSYADTGKVQQIEAEECVMLTFTAPPSLFGKPGIFVSISGSAKLIREKAQFEKHWSKGLDLWFPEGIDTPALVLIKVEAKTIQYWDGEENGTITLLGADIEQP